MHVTCDIHPSRRDLRPRAGSPAGTTIQRKEGIHAYAFSYSKRQTAHFGDWQPANNPVQVPAVPWLWIVLGLLAVGALYGFVGLTWWSLPIATLMLGWPIVIVWVLLGGFER
jgi:hypothetical protein